MFTAARRARTHHAQSLLADLVYRRRNYARARCRNGMERTYWELCFEGRCVVVLKTDSLPGFEVQPRRPPGPLVEASKKTPASPVWHPRTFYCSLLDLPECATLMMVDWSGLS